MIKEKKTVMIWRRYLTVYKNIGIEVLSHIQTDWRIDMADGTITAKQKEILEYIKSEILKRGFPPAVREICEAVHLKSTSSVHSHLESLERKGYIRRDPTKPRAIEISDISRSLKEIARELQVPVLALSQLSRAVEQRPDHRPMLSDLRESGAIEQDADVVMFLYRDDYYNKDSEKKNIAEVIIAKQRNGPIGTVELAWLPNLTKFANLKK